MLWQPGLIFWWTSYHWGWSSSCSWLLRLHLYLSVLALRALRSQVGPAQAPAMQFLLSRLSAGRAASALSALCSSQVCLDPDGFKNLLLPLRTHFSQKESSLRQCLYLFPVSHPSSCILCASFCSVVFLLSTWMCWGRGCSSAPLSQSIHRVESTQCSVQKQGETLLMACRGCSAHNSHHSLYAQPDFTLGAAFITYYNFRQQEALLTSLYRPGDGGIRIFNLSNV